MCGGGQKESWWVAGWRCPAESKRKRSEKEGSPTCPHAAGSGQVEQRLLTDGWSWS